MNILTALMKTDARVAYEYRWLVWDKKSELWEVHECKLDDEMSHLVGITKSEDQAVEWLLEEK